MASHLSASRWVRRHPSSRTSSCEARLPFGQRVRNTDEFTKRSLTPQGDILRVAGNVLTEDEKAVLESNPEVLMPVFYIRQSEEVLAGRQAVQLRQQTNDNNWLLDARHGRPADRPSSRYVAVPHDHLQFRYEVVQEIGRGRFSQVVTAIDHGHFRKRIVSVKVLNKTEEGRSMTSRWTHEVNTLKMLRSAALSADERAPECHVLLLLHEFQFDGHCAIVTPKHEMSLADDCICGENMAPYEAKVVLHDILHALAFLSDKGIVHTDIRMQNIFVDRLDQQEGRRIKATVGDFGSAVTEKALRRYDGAGWSRCPFASNLNCLGRANLRAPEIILNYDGKIGCGVDMWAAGCIFLRLLTGKPLVIVYNSEAAGLEEKERTVLQTIEQRLGSIVLENGGLRMHRQLLRRSQDPLVGLVPDERLGESISKQPVFVKENGGYLALDLLYRMLHLNADKRPRAHDMLSHSYFTL